MDGGSPCSRDKHREQPAVQLPATVFWVVASLAIAKRCAAVAAAGCKVWKLLDFTPAHLVWTLRALCVATLLILVVVCVESMVSARKDQRNSIVEVCNG